MNLLERQELNKSAERFYKNKFKFFFTPERKLFRSILFFFLLNLIAIGVHALFLEYFYIITEDYLAIPVAAFILAILPGKLALKLIRENKPVKIAYSVIIVCYYLIAAVMYPIVMAFFQFCVFAVGDIALYTKGGLLKILEVAGIILSLILLWFAGKYIRAHSRLSSKRKYVYLVAAIIVLGGCLQFFVFGNNAFTSKRTVPLGLTPNTAYFIKGDKLIAADYSKGDTLWKFDLKSIGIESHHHIFNRTFASNNKVLFFGTLGSRPAEIGDIESFGEIVAVNRESGRLEWSNYVDGGMNNDINIEGDEVYFSNYSTPLTVKAFSIESGQELWQVRGVEAYAYSDGTLYTEKYKTIEAIDPKLNRNKWTYTSPHKFAIRQFIGNDANYIFYSVEDPEYIISALDKETGDEVWSSRPNTSRPNTRLLDDKLFIYSSDKKKLTVMDPETGSIIKDIKLDQWFGSDYAMRDNIVYFAGRNSDKYIRIYAFDIKSYEMLWQHDIAYNNLPLTTKPILINDNLYLLHESDSQEKQLYRLNIKARTGESLFACYSSSGDDFNDPISDGDKIFFDCNNSIYIIDGKTGNKIAEL